MNAQENNVRAEELSEAEHEGREKDHEGVELAEHPELHPQNTYYWLPFVGGDEQYVEHCLV